MLDSEIRERFSKLGIIITEDMLVKFETYFSFLIEYNANVNLTAITEKDDVYVKHFLDSILPYKEIPKGAKICDIGTGAGFPALPLKIVRPDLKVTLVDCLDKRVNFLKALVEKLKLENVECLHSRAEDLAQDDNYREIFDVAVSRGVAKLNTLSEYCLPFVKVGGKMLAYKSMEIDEELTESTRAVIEFGGAIDEVKKYKIPGTDIERKIVVIGKYDETPKKYPRGMNKPKLMPIE